MTRHAGTPMKIGDFAWPVSVRADAECEFPVYAVTKHEGMVPSAEYFKKQVYSRNLEGYKVVGQGQFAYATIHLDEGSIGVLGTAEHCIISPMYTVFEVDENRVHAPYLLRVLKSPWALSHYATMGSGSVHRRRSISFETLSRLSVPLPDIAEQRRIAAILDKADSLRRKRQEAIRLTDELVRSKFEKMFGEPRTNAKGLPTISLGELVKLKSGNFLPSHEMAGTGGVLVYGGNGVNGEHDRAMFDEVKLVIGRVGAHCGAVHLTEPCNWITDNALYVSEISPQVRLEYLAFALTQANLNQYSSQSGQPLVSASRLYPVMLVLPPLSLQDDFLEVLNRAKLIQASQANSLRTIEEMSLSLAAELFTQG